MAVPCRPTFCRRTEKGHAGNCRYLVQASTGRAGYRLEAAEVERLCAAMDIGRTGWLAKSQLAASQIDWQALQARPHPWRPTCHVSGLHGACGYRPPGDAARSGIFRWG